MYLLLVVIMLTVKGDHMGKELEKYDGELAKRLENIRKQHHITQEEMAHRMGVSVGQYKRYIYLKSRVPAGKLATLIDNLALDVNYVLYGRITSSYDFVNFMKTATYAEMAEMYLAISQMYKKKEKAMERVDYVTNKGTVIETKRKRKE